MINNNDEHHHDDDHHDEDEEDYGLFQNSEYEEYFHDYFEHQCYGKHKCHLDINPKDRHESVNQSHFNFDDYSQPLDFLMKVSDQCL